MTHVIILLRLIGDVSPDQSKICRTISLNHNVWHGLHSRIRINSLLQLHSAAKNHVSIQNFDRSSLRLYGDWPARVEKMELISTLPLLSHTGPV